MKSVLHLIPICVYKVALNLEFEFFLSKAKNADLAALGQGFLTHEKEKSIEGYAPLYRFIGISILSFLIFTSCKTESENTTLVTLPSAPSTIGSKENPNKRFDYELAQIIDPVTKQVPLLIHQKENVFVKSIKSRAELYPNHRIKELTWALAGPSNIGGRTRALAIDVSNEEIILAGGVSGGMWKSENGGRNWTRTSQPSAINSATCLVQDTRFGKKATWYFGTGELRGNSPRASGAPYRGDGIFKSTDGGNTWDILPTTSNNQLTIFESPFNYVWNMAINTTNQIEDEIYAALYGNIVKSLDGGTTWLTVLGSPDLLKDETGDLNDSNASFYTNILITPTGKMYAFLSTSTGQTNVTTNKGIFYSEDGDSWENITPIGFSNVTDRLVMTYAPSNEDILYFLVDGGATQLWKYQNGVWANRSVNIPQDSENKQEAFDSQGSYNMVLKVHPEDSETVFLGGTNLYRSTDGFVTSDNITQIGGYDIENVSSAYAGHHPDQHQIVFFSEENKMLTGNDGGIYKTSNNLSSTVSWTSLNNEFVTSQFYSVALSKVSGSTAMLGGMQDNGTSAKSQAGENVQWSPILGGDGSYCATTDDDVFWYASFQEGNIFKLAYNSKGELSSWAQVNPVGVDREDYLFITPFVLDPSNNNRMYLAANDAIWRNDNLSQIPNGIQSPTSINWKELIELPLGDQISALDISTSPGHTLYYGTTLGNIYKLSAANENSSDPELLFSQDGYVSNICIDPSNTDHFLFTYSNYHVISIYASIDGGKTITNVSGSLEENEDGTGSGPSIRWSEVIPLNDGTHLYFVATSTGVYSTSLLNGLNTEWLKEGSASVGNSVVTMMDYRSADGKIVAATHGNGVFDSSIDNALSIEANDGLENDLIVLDGYPNPFSNSFNIRFSNPELSPLSILVIDASGKVIRHLLNYPQFKGDVNATWDGKNDSGTQVPNGMYHFMILRADQVYSGKMVLIN